VYDLLRFVGRFVLRKKKLWQSRAKHLILWVNLGNFIWQVRFALCTAGPGLSACFDQLSVSDSSRG
jgi:hypothetical protein